MQRVRLNMVSSTFKVVIALMLALIPLLSVVPASAEPEFPELISKSTDGQQADDGVGYKTRDVQMSDNGRYVAYLSDSSNLGGQPSGTNRLIYVYDRVTEATTLASVTGDGEQVNGKVYGFALTGDGRHVAFRTNAANLDPNATEFETYSVYIHSLDSGNTALVSVDNAGQRIYSSASLVLSASYDGSVVVFSGARDSGEMYVRDMTNDFTEQLPQGGHPMVSSDGNKVLYTSLSTWGSPTQAMVYDRSTGVSTMASVTPDGSPSGDHSYSEALSANGRYVLFSSRASNILPESHTPCTLSNCDRLYRRDIVDNITERVDVTMTGDDLITDGSLGPGGYSISSDGSVVAFTYSDSDVGNIAQAAIRNFDTGITRIVSTNSGGELADSDVLVPSLNGSGTLVAFRTYASNFGVTNSEYQAFVTTTGTDTTNPTITYELSSEPNPAGWNNSDVTVTFTCDDAESGIASCPDPVVVSTEGVDQVVSGTAVDNVGNEASTEVLISLDKTAPELDYTLDPAANAAGWNNSDVIVTFNCTDSLSGVDTCTGPGTITTEGNNHQVPGSVTDLAGNTADTTAMVKLDKTDPTITTPTMSGLLFGLMLGPTTDISATVDDNFSGVVQAEYYFNTDPGEGNGTAMTLNSSTATATANTASLGAGQHTLYVRSLDAAGNWSTVAERSFLRLF